ncbi:MAG: LPS biosynthesis protein [Candidatus Peregrinibacteria bacterium Greene0416_62]|nr:MAG: LPS biosynthesis protein [Candidatus Peregrinibacteria bacterium Greene0416_62]TSC97484.1 MAG: LPS biosynthesis protein [Candidatus Peregrinibacteria bacterium Greene1014_49]
MLETQDMISFDEQGICATCRQIEYKQGVIDWEERKKEFQQILTEHRGKGSYDCIVPFSGGKDSTFAALALVKDFGLKPLIVSFDHGFYRPKVLRNTERTVKKLGVDYLRFKSDWQTVKKLMRESLIRKGDIMWHSHCGIFAYPMHMAVKLNVPLIIWGEQTSEYVSYYSYEEKEQVDEKRFNRVVNLGINAEDMVGMLDGKVTLRDLEPYTYPKLKDLRAIGYRSICLGTYVPWDTKMQSARIHKELGWEGDQVEGIPYERYWYEKIEDAFQGIQDYLKWLKRGMSRMTHLASIDIRNGRMTRDEGLKMIEKYEGYRPASLDVFLKAIDMSEEEFHKIAAQHVVAPHVMPDWRKIPRGSELPDQKDWMINIDLE